MDIEEIVKSLSLETKIALLTGEDFWRTKGIEDLIPSVRMADGPHGLRVQRQSGSNFTDSHPSTCFPTASALACSWNTHLAYSVGAAIAKEATAIGVHVVLAPGVNIKRNPLCGRNFEYYSEDPFLSGEMGAAFVSGIQFSGVGACVKHFAANNQEKYRLVANSIVDEKALRDIYLYPFERIVKENPRCIMSAYNRLNGTYCSNNSRLIKDILRDEWGYEGVVVSDWGAVNDKTASIRAGLDLEMPSSGTMFDSQIFEAIKNGSLTESDIDRSVKRLLNLVDNVYVEPSGYIDCGVHNELAYEAAAESAVLLKNDGILPLKRGKRVVVFGDGAVNPRYQGGGSSRVNPSSLTNVVMALSDTDFDAEYYPDAELDGEIERALSVASGCYACVVFVGHENVETEGVDKAGIKLSGHDNSLIEALIDAGNKVVVVLNCGSCVEMDWADKASAILLAGLNGQGGGLAIADILTGAKNPSGKLAETFAYKYQDYVSAPYYGKDGKNNLYLESIYVGYRYFDKAGLEVRYPFGHGLSYTTFDYSNLVVKKTDEYAYSVSFTITNSGNAAGSEVCQLYIKDCTSNSFCAPKQLKGFKKVSLYSGEKTAVTINLCKRDFETFDTETNSFVVYEGDYKLLIGSSSKDIRLVSDISLAGKTVNSQNYGWYSTCQGKITREEFFDRFKNLEANLVTPSKKATIYSTLNDIRHTFIGKIMLKSLLKETALYGEETPEYLMALETGLNCPLCTMPSFSGGKLNLLMVGGIVDFANKRFIRGVKKFFKGKRRLKRAQKKAKVRQK